MFVEVGYRPIVYSTVDNANSNDVAIDYVKKNTKERDSTILGGEFMYVRCCAHILNLIV